MYYYLKFSLSLIYILLALPSFSQDSRKTLITIESREISLRELLDEITKQSGYHVLVNTAQVDLNQYIKVQWKNKQLKGALEDISKRMELQCTLSGKHIIVAPKMGARLATQSVSGFVSDENGIPLHGVYVHLKGSDQGTLTDSLGYYKFLVANKGNILELSYFNYAPREIKIEKERHDVVLQPEFENLEEVVVIGYGTQERKDLSGAVSSIKSKPIAAFPSASIESAIQGRVAGMQVVNNSGNPGGEVYVRIRGNASLIGKNQPLYIIDGVPILNENYYDNTTSSIGGGQHISILSDINPRDIESIEVLKDAAASSIFGSRGSNGVILVTTKSGKGAGKLKLNIDSYYGIQSVQKRYPLLDASQYTAYANDAITLSKSNRPLAPSIAVHNTDWQDQIFRRAPISNYNHALSHQDSLTNLYVSVGSFSQQGIVIGSAFTRYNIRVNMDHQFSQRFKAGTSVMASSSSNDRVMDGTSSLGIIGTALLKRPTLPVYSSSGEYSYDSAGLANPVKTANDVLFKLHSKRLIASANAEYSLNNGLSIKSQFSIDYLSLKERVLLPPNLIDFRSGTRTVNSFGEEILLVNESMLLYKKELGFHHLQSLIGVGVQQSNYKTEAANNQTSFTGVVTSELSAATIPWKINSAFGRVNYDYKDKYIANLNFRLDGSSRLSPQIRYGAFPSLAFAWRLSGENFMQNISIISDLKLRTSYGVTGNQDIRNYNDKGFFLASPNLNVDMNKLPNANLQWERTKQVNLGIDAAGLKGRISFSADAYHKSSNNLLLWKNVPLDSGNVWVVNNMAGMYNKGLEFALRSQNLEGRLRWSTTFNISFIKNKITRIEPRGDRNNPNSRDYLESIRAYVPSSPTISSIYRPQEAFGSFYGYQYLGVDPLTGRPLYKDINSDGIIDEEDMSIIGNALPKAYGGFVNELAWRSLELEFFFQWSYGNKIYNLTRATMNSMNAADRYNATDEVLDRWRQPGDVAEVPGPYLGSKGAPNLLPSSRWIEDGSYLRLQNIKFTWKIPARFVSRFGIKTAKIYCSTQNLLTFTRYSGLDPESQNQASKNSQLGVDVFTYPTPRAFLGGLNIEF